MEKTDYEIRSIAWDNSVEWEQYSACTPETAEVWFPQDVAKDGFPAEVTDKRDPRVLKAQRKCGSCAVQLQCLEFAVRTGQDSGIWGGFTSAERAKIGTNSSRYDMSRLIEKQNKRVVVEAE